MLGLTQAALAMLEATSAVVWKDDGTVVTGIALPNGKPQISMSGIYACCKS